MVTQNARYTDLDHLFQLGFDQSELQYNHYRVKCSQCEALTINGMPTHEHGCPNAMHECKACWNVIPMNQKYCEDCQ